MPETQNRKLAAVLFADIVGYTKLMQEDETAAATLLHRFRTALEEQVAAHNGRIVNFYGDGALCVFQNPLESVHCAMALQTNFRVTPAAPVRIGIHSGTVVFEADNVYGDSVNLASRIESMGIPGAVLFSKKIQDELKNQPKLKVASLGNFQFKNVDGPLEVFALANEGFPVPKRTELKGKFKTSKSWNRIAYPMLAGLFALTLLLYTGYHFFMQNQYSGAAETPDAIAIFPFDVKGSPSVQYLGEGMVDLISTKLDDIPGINSIDPNLIFSRLEQGSRISRKPDEAAVLARSFSAHKFILGSIVEIDSTLQITASKYNAAGNLLDKKSVDFHKSGQLTNTIDKLVKNLIADELSEKGQELGSLAATTSDNLASLKAYLEGEQALRKGNNISAYEKFCQATEMDSTFALAWMRMIDAAAWNFDIDASHAYAMWAAYKHKLPQKWKEYHDAFMLYNSGDRRAGAAFERLIRKYGASRAFTFSLGEYLFHFGPVYGSSIVQAKTYFIKVLALEPNNKEALVHLSDIAREQQDMQAMQDILSKIDPESEMYPEIKINALILQDSVSDTEIETYLTHPDLRPPHLTRTLLPIKDKEINYSLNERLVRKYNNAMIQSISQIMCSGIQGKEREADRHWDKLVSNTGQLPIPASLYQRCLPASLIADPGFAPLEEKYPQLFETLTAAESPWELYAAIKYGLALKKGAMVKKLRAKLLKLTTVDGQKTQARYFQYSLQAYEARLAGDNDVALSYIDSAYSYPYGYWQIQTTCLDKKIMLANIHAERGDYETAIAHFENLPHAFGYEFIAGYANYRLSQWYEKAGNWERALIKCNLLLKSYRDCDPKYQSWLKETEQRKVRLITKMQ